MSGHLSVEHTKLAAENDPELPWSSRTILQLCDRIAELEDENARLIGWKNEAIAVLDQWENVFEAAHSIEVARLGESKSAVVMRVVQRMAVMGTPIVGPSDE